MIEMQKVGKQIALLRKEKGLTQEKLADSLNISSQAVSKWENGHTLPDTVLLPELSSMLGCSIDNILMPKELHILSALYTDGVVFHDVTQLLNRIIDNNSLNIIINENLLQHSIQNDRMKFLILKYQNPLGEFYCYGQKGNCICIDSNTTGYEAKLGELEFVFAAYGREDNHIEIIQKIQHYKYFNWQGFYAHHETFPSPPDNDGLDYLSIIYLNDIGLHVISCAEGERIFYNQYKTILTRDDIFSKNYILEDVQALSFGKNMDCSWAGALYTALKYMGEETTYEEVMGVSGACWRMAFTSIWDYSSVDGLVAYDYATPGYAAFGYTPIWADRIDKKKRSNERNNIVKSINDRKPPIAINLRVAPEWGIITGYLDEGKTLLCRSYFDKETFEGKKDDLEFIEEMKKTKGYLYVDNWPFAIAHFNQQGRIPTNIENFINSLKVKIDSMKRTENRGYALGYNAFKVWQDGLKDENWYLSADNSHFMRRLSVNHFCMLSLVDARRCAAEYLKKCMKLFDGETYKKVFQMAEIYSNISKFLIDYLSYVPSDESIEGASLREAWTKEQRLAQSDLFDKVIKLEEKSDKYAEEILELILK